MCIIRCNGLHRNFVKLFQTFIFQELKLEITFDPFETTNITTVDLKNLKNCLLKSYFFQTEGDFRNDGKFYQVEKSNHIESENACKICKKKFAHRDILNFHQKSGHHQEIFQSPENFILEKNPTGNPKLR